MNPLTSRQSDILAFLNGYSAEHGYPPTIREIGERFEIASPNGVMCHLKALETKGRIKRAANQSRAMKLLR